MNKFSELKDALEFLETTEFDGEWDSALVGGENGKNYHAVINANDVVVRPDDDSRHASWLCDYLEVVSPLNIRALLAELEAKDKRIAELENAPTIKHMRSVEESLIRATDMVSELEKRLATPVQLQNCDFESVAIMAHWCTDEQLKAWVKGVDHAKKQIRAAGFKVEGDE